MQLVLTHFQVMSPKYNWPQNSWRYKQAFRKLGTINEEGPPASGWKRLLFIEAVKLFFEWKRSLHAWGKYQNLIFYILSSCLPVSPLRLSRMVTVMSEEWLTQVTTVEKTTCTVELSKEEAKKWTYASGIKDLCATLYDKSAATHLKFLTKMPQTIPRVTEELQ